MNLLRTIEDYARNSFGNTLPIASVGGQNSLGARAYDAMTPPANTAGIAGFQQYMQWLQQQQRKQLQLEQAQTEQSKAQAEFRRQELASRSGYAGTVNTGRPATILTPGRLAARMAQLPANDPTRVAYQNALADQETRRRTLLKKITADPYQQVYGTPAPPVDTSAPPAPAKQATPPAASAPPNYGPGYNPLSDPAIPVAGPNATAMNPFANSA